MFNLKVNETIVMNNKKPNLMMMKQRIISFLIQNINTNIEFPDGWSWNTSLMSNYISLEKETIFISGTLTERIEQYLKRKYNIHLSPRNIQLLEIVQNKKLKCQIVDHFDWTNDWEYSKLAKNLLLKCGVRPILFYNIEDQRIGYAMTIDRGDKLIVFDANGLLLEEITNVLAEHFGCQYKVEDLTNIDDPHKIIFKQSNSVAVLYYGEYTNLDISINIGDYEICEACNKIFHIDELTNIHIHYHYTTCDGKQININEDILFCKECLKNQFVNNDYSFRKLEK